MADKIQIKDGKLIVPDQPIIPFIEGDGIGPDIWAASQRVIDAAVEHTYHGARKIEWLEVLCGEKSFNKNELFKDLYANSKKNGFIKLSKYFLNFNFMLRFSFIIPNILSLTNSSNL